MWKNEETCTAQVTKDQSTIAQQESGSNSSSVDGNLTPSGGVGPRWADPAAHAVKLLEDALTEGSDLPFENNLVADCSPTAPYCLDLHRRLYLAQYNIVDTGAPISPSSCPSCLPIQSLSEADSVFNSNSVPMTEHSKLVAQHNLRNTSANSSKTGDGAEGQAFHKAKQAPSKSSSGLPAGHSASVLASSGSKSIRGEDNPLTIVTYCSSCQFSAAPSNSLKQSIVDSNVPDSSAIHGAGDGSLAHPTTSTALAEHHHVTIIQCPDSYSSLRTLPCAHKHHHDRGLYSQNYCTHLQSWPDHEDEQSHPSATRPNSSMSKDLSSLDKLSLILSEDPSAQNSSHNFRSMPGFVMKNPDLINILPERDSPSPEKDSSENSEDQQSSLYPINTDYLGNHIQDIEVQQTSASLPSSPIRFGVKPDPAAQNIHEEILKGRCKHLSPLLGRKGRDSPVTSQDPFLGMEDLKFSQQYQSLEAFQKAQLKQKMRRRLNSASGRLEQARTFTMHNKAPLWNETSQVYQLDFGGRVTQESAKNFQIELRGKQVMQFGRIDNNAYTLDFQYPFTAVQAFAVALANVTQRLK
ncbi:unnamed protein product [Lymnaea stagnalis]|uniref:Tubby C-terminal domain-containing protein n=1 Tax=Lymnaea stagnalis TaxID=6523 RepID=A0AAV2HDZ6_LYMST